jgi:hypothetical protein
MLHVAMRGRAFATILSLVGAIVTPALAAGQTVADLVRETSPQVVRVRVGPPGRLLPGRPPRRSGAAVSPAEPAPASSSP